MKLRAGYKIVCYYESWAVYRPQPLDFGVSDIDASACTHLIYAFAGLDETNYTISSLDHDYDIVTGKSLFVLSRSSFNISRLLILKYVFDLMLHDVYTNILQKRLLARQIVFDNSL